MPDVAGVSVLLDPPEPRLTVIQLADWHFVPPEVFGADERTHDADVTNEQMKRITPRFSRKSERFRTNTERH